MTQKSISEQKMEKKEKEELRLINVWPRSFFLLSPSTSIVPSRSNAEPRVIAPTLSYACLPVCLSVCLSVCFSACPPARPSVQAARYYTYFFARFLPRFLVLKRQDA